MYRVCLIVLVLCVGVGVAAAPAFADAGWNGPNCQGSVISGVVAGNGLSEVAASFGVSVQAAQEFIQTGCVGSTSNTPRCEAGQLSAADEALARGDTDQWMFHLGALENCYLGSPAGPPL